MQALVQYDARAAKRVANWRKARAGKAILADKAILAASEASCVAVERPRPSGLAGKAREVQAQNGASRGIRADPGSDGVLEGQQDQEKLVDSQTGNIGAAGAEDHYSDSAEVDKVAVDTGGDVAGPLDAARA